MKKQRLAIAITKPTIEAVALWVSGSIGIQAFMDRTGTTTTSCYSVIARTVRDHHKDLNIWPSSK